MLGQSRRHDVTESGNTSYLLERW